MSPNSFTLVYLNAQSMPSDRLLQWQMLAGSLDPTLPTTPRLYAFVEAGSVGRQPGLPDWSSSHVAGPAAPARGTAGGGITIFHHVTCPVLPLPKHHLLIPAHASTPNASSTTSIAWHIVQPNDATPFLLAVVYLPPACVAGQPTHYLQPILKSIDDVVAEYPNHPLLVVGDFNMQHLDWHQPIPSLAAHHCANHLAAWIESSFLTIHNEPGVITRPPSALGAQGTIIDLVLSRTPAPRPFVTALTQRHATRLASDHRPFTVELHLPRHQPAAAPCDPLDRPRRVWDIHSQPDVWQDQLPSAMAFNLAPVQPLLAALSQPIPPTTTARAVLDAAYDAVLEAITTSCLEVVGTKQTTARSVPWFNYPGVRTAYSALRAATRAHHGQHPSLVTRAGLLKARADWKRVSTEAKALSNTELYQSIAAPEGKKLMWSLFRRTTASPFTSLAAVVDTTGTLPVNRSAALTNVAQAFVSGAEPPPLTTPAHQAAYDAIRQQVHSWGDELHPTIPPHCSDAWATHLTCAEVKRQCTTQHTNTAPGPDAILPLFLRYGGDAVWSALAAIYSCSWQHSLTPQSWREANVMALYKNAGPKESSNSYRPISMTSIIIRTFEHLVHRHLVEQLEPILPALPYFADHQYGFRKGRTTIDAILYLVTAVQQVLRREETPPCPVLFLDLKKAFDRVDHNLLLHRLHAAGIHGRAWLWVRSFLSQRRMRVVDSAAHSAWQSVDFGVPQGCVLSPLLFLVFINDVVSAIATDPNCRLISPLFFADDGALVPNPYASVAPPATYPARYLQQLQRAIALLDRWCIDSRMQFGQAKTQLLVCTAQKKALDTSAYAGLRLCGFDISLTTHYTYLGVIVEQKLAWTRHYAYALARAHTDASRLTRIALHSRTPQLLIIRTLVTAYLVARFTYGCLLWARKLDEPKCVALQACIARPLRAALELPRTTHQLGTLHLCNVPTIASITLQAELAHAHRVYHLPATHPTRRLHQHSLAQLAGKAPHLVLSPAYALSTAAHIATTVLPVTFYSPGLADRLGAATCATLRSYNDPLHPPLSAAVWPLGADFFDKTVWPPKTQREWSQANYTASHLTRTLRWAIHAVQHLTPANIRLLSRQKRVQQWESQHVTAQPTAHVTTAPLTQCKPDAGLAPFFLHDDRRQSIRRARLLMGRSYTQSIRCRFPKSTVPPPQETACTFHLCQPTDALTAPPDDSIEHILLRCHRHTAARAALRSALVPLFPPPAPPALTMSTILCATLPPPPFQPSNLTTLLHCSNVFLDRVDVERAADPSLLPFDPG
jgi:hypothetical protein